MKSWLRNYGVAVALVVVIIGVVVSAVVWQCSTPDRVPARPGEIVSDPLEESG